MGYIAEAMVQYAQPLIDATDGAPDGFQKALSLSQLCWNLAVLPEEQRDRSLAEMQSALKMDDEEFREFKSGVVIPMIHRHQAMFPQMQHRGAPDSPGSQGEQAIPPTAQKRPAKPYAGTGRNERCPCGSGKKYKVCCGR